MTDSTIPGRIPFEAINDAKSWCLPEVDGKVANKEEQLKRRTQTLKRKSDQAQRKTPVAPATSQDVEVAEEAPVKPLTARELEEITHAAEQDGFEKGYNEGLEQGKAEGRKAGFSEGLQAGTEQAESEHGQWLKEQGSYLASLCENLLNPVQAQQQELADVVFDLAVGLAKELLAAELRADPAKIVPIIDQAIAALPSAEKNISLALHPDDLEAYQRFAPFPGGADRASADASLERGSCRVKSEHSYVDYSVAARLLDFKAALEGSPTEEPAPVPAIERPNGDEQLTPESPMAVTDETHTEQSLAAQDEANATPAEARDHGASNQAAETSNADDAEPSIDEEPEHQGARANADEPSRAGVNPDEPHHD